MDEAIPTQRDLKVHIIRPGAVYGLAQAQIALGLTKTTLGREIRLGRLRVAKRGGKYMILGSWLLEWIASGEVSRQTADGETLRQI
jgi:hypothetical protein